MTLDQIYLRVSDVKRVKSIGHESRSLDSFQAGAKLKGRAADGTKIEGVIRGKSIAREAMERAAKRKAEPRKRRKSRRKSNGT